MDRLEKLFQKTWSNIIYWFRIKQIRFNSTGKTIELIKSVCGHTFTINRTNGVWVSRSESFGDREFTTPEEMYKAMLWDKYLSTETVSNCSSIKA